MKFIVAQVGARRAYGVPSILQSADMLDRFYTDICADTGLGRWLVKGRYLPILAGPLNKLFSRRLPDNIKDKSFAFAAPTIKFILSQFLNRLTHGSSSSAIQEHWAIDVGNAMARAGFGKATHLYCMYGETPTLMAAAKRNGISVVTECYVIPSTDKVVAEERSKFPDWELFDKSATSIEQEAKSKNYWKLPDFVIAPSEAVRDEVIKVSGIPVERIAVIPYGVNATWLDLINRPVPRRVLFVGTADLRKGIQYLAIASRKINDGQPGKSFDFRVAGGVKPEVASQNICDRLNFLGRIPRQQIQSEYCSADVFVLPSLAEGSAEATYEALAAGVPVITTHAAGSVVRNGIEGRIVPERDAAALAQAILDITENRALRNKMAIAARERAKDYTWEKYGERLVLALNGFDPKPAILS